MHKKERSGKGARSKKGEAVRKQLIQSQFVLLPKMRELALDFWKDNCFLNFDVIAQKSC